MPASAMRRTTNGHDGRYARQGWTPGSRDRLASAPTTKRSFPGGYHEALADRIVAADRAIGLGAAGGALRSPSTPSPNPLQLPANMYFGEVSGVSVNSKGHVFVLSRGNTSGPAYAAAATQLAGIRRQRRLRPRNRQEPLCLVVRTHREGRSPGQYLGDRQGLRHGDQVRSRGPRRHGVRPQAGSLRRRYRAAEASEAAAAGRGRPVSPGHRRGLGQGTATPSSATAISIRASPRWTRTATG